MAAIFLRNATVTIDGADRSDDVENFTLTPSTEDYTFTPVSGNIARAVGATSWTCSFNYTQDYSSADTITMKSISSVGQSVSAVFKPKGTAVGGPTISATIILKPGVVGGGQGLLLATAEWPVVGQPNITTGT